LCRTCRTVSELALKKNTPLEQLGNLLNPAGRLFLLQFCYLVPNRFGQARLRMHFLPILQPFLSKSAINADPLVNGRQARLQLLGNQTATIAFNQTPTPSRDYLDDITFSSQQAPEPSTFVLTGSGISGSLLMGRRSKGAS
jgi:hypothetical protein